MTRSRGLANKQLSEPEAARPSRHGGRSLCSLDDALGEHLWGERVPVTPVKERKWTQYIDVGVKLIAADKAISDHAKTQVNERTKHFYRTMSPEAFLEVCERRAAATTSAKDKS